MTIEIGSNTLKIRSILSEIRSISPQIRSIVIIKILTFDQNPTEGKVSICLISKKKNI